MHGKKQTKRLVQPLLETHMPLGYVNKTDMQMFTHSVLLLCTEIITLQPPATHYTNDHY